MKHLARFLLDPKEPSPHILRCRAQISPKALVHNFRTLREMSRNRFVIPMIKADGYGHGARWAARVLQNEEGLLGFGVATVHEAHEVREALGARGRSVLVFCFSGMIPWQESYGELCERDHFVPVIATIEDLRAFIKNGWNERIPFEIEFNTGMNRLGIGVNQLTEVKRLFAKATPRGKPHGVFTHLAAGDEPQFQLTQLQISQYLSLRSELDALFPQTHFHFAASSAIFNEKHFPVESHSDVIRPGISLYGVRPWKGAPQRSLQPVLSFQGRVAQVHSLKTGESVGYGGTFRVSSKNQPLPYGVATVTAGYADGVHRRLSNRGFGILGAERVPLVGRVSMDLCSVHCPKSTRPGDWVEFFGFEGDIWDQSERAETIPYELLTSISSRVPRVETA